MQSRDAMHGVSTSIITGSGGGIVVIPKGTFLTGAVSQKQGADLRVDEVQKGEPVIWEKYLRTWRS